MKPVAPVDPAAANRGGGQTKIFRRHNSAPRLSHEQTRRQSDVLRCAWRHFGEPGPVIAFLNTQHDQLKGQPLHLAVESDEGLRRVETLLEEMTFRAQPSPGGE